MFSLKNWLLSFFLLFFLENQLCFTQVKSDSLFILFSNNTSPDSVRFHAMDQLADRWLFQNPDTSLFLSGIGLKMAAEKKENKWEGIFYNLQGLAWYVKSDFIRSLESLLISQKKWEKTSDKKGLARCFGNIGLVFQSQNEPDKALAYQQKALITFKEANETKGVANTLGNIANIYREKNNTLKAIGYYTASLAEFIKIGGKRGIATSHLNLADLYFSKENLDSAVFHVQQCENYFSESKNKKALSALQSVKGRILQQKGKYREAIKLCSDALINATEINSLEDEKNSCICLSESYEKLKDLANSLKYYKQYNSIRDSLKNQEKAKAIARTELKFIFDKKTAQDSLFHVQENKLSELKIVEEKKQKYYLFIFLGLALVFSFFMVNRFFITRKQKRIIHMQKTQVLGAFDQLHEKNKEITDSIRYAERIQSAIMPKEENFQELFPACFIFFRPKDIVSGDFYWLYQTDEYFFYATADCTGHGVPGGFMSMLGERLLDEVVGDRKIHDPADALDLMRIKIIQALKQSAKTGENKDGMDMVLCRIKKDLSELTYSAANNPLWIFSQGKMNEYAADKQPVGFYDESPKQFTQHTIKLTKGDVIYTFTDGYADQFGGPKGKKFKYRQLIELITEFNQKKLDLASQKKELVKVFDEWKNNVEQVDDVTAVCIEV